MYGARFSLGPDGDVYLVGRVALEHLTVEELDRIIGVLYELTERWFQPVVQLAYGRRTRPPDRRSSARSTHGRATAERLSERRARRGRFGSGPEVQDDRSVRGSAERDRTFLGLGPSATPS